MGPESAMTLHEDDSEYIPPPPPLVRQHIANPFPPGAPYHASFEHMVRVIDRMNAIPGGASFFERWRQVQENGPVYI